MRGNILALAAVLVLSVFGRPGEVLTASVSRGAARTAFSSTGVVRVAVDGREVETWGLARVGGGAVLVPLRPVSEALGATSVVWDEDGDGALVSGPGVQLRVPFESEYIEANGRCWYTPGGVPVPEGRCLVPAEFLAFAFGAELDWDGETGFMAFTSGGEPAESGESFYGGEELYWLARIIDAEAGAEPFEGKIAVGNVVMNRVEDGDFPDTVKGVIFDRRYGVQFTPAYSGSINRTPSADSTAAAKLALEGVTVVDGALYFASRRAARSCWASRHCEVLAEISGHVFFG